MRWDEIVGDDGQLLRDVCAGDLDVNRETLEQVLLLAIEISRELVRESPKYDPSAPLGPRDENALYEHYGFSRSR